MGYHVVLALGKPLRSEEAAEIIDWDSLIPTSVSRLATSKSNSEVFACKAKQYFEYTFTDNPEDVICCLIPQRLFLEDSQKGNIKTALEMRGLVEDRNLEWMTLEQCKQQLMLTDCVAFVYI